MLSLGQAARLAGTSKTTLTRAIKTGRLSATRRDGGGYQIDAAELSRVFTVTPETVTATGNTVHHATPLRDLHATPDVVTRMAELEAELRGLKELLAEVRANRDELREDRDQWRGRAERLLVDQRQPWWKRMVG